MFGWDNRLVGWSDWKDRITGGMGWKYWLVAWDGMVGGMG